MKGNNLSLSPLPRFPAWHSDEALGRKVETLKQGRLVHKGDWGDALPRGKGKKKKKNSLCINAISL